MEFHIADFMVSISHIIVQMEVIISNQTNKNIVT